MIDKLVAALMQMGDPAAPCGCNNTFQALSPALLTTAGKLAEEIQSTKSAEGIEWTIGHKHGMFFMTTELPGTNHSFRIFAKYSSTFEEKPRRDFGNPENQVFWWIRLNEEDPQSFNSAQSAVDALFEKILPDVISERREEKDEEQAEEAIINALKERYTT